MLARRIIPCLDVRDGVVVKGTQFQNHEIVGDILELALRYCLDGADELVFYDITASVEGRKLDTAWIKKLARFLNIPFCVAGGIRSLSDAAEVLSAGADKVSINTPALENPNLISELCERFGQQCVVVGIDSKRVGEDYEVCSHTGSVSALRNTGKKTRDWVREVVDRGAGEIVLNCMDRDGTGLGYDSVQLKCMRKITPIPLIASGGARKKEDFAKIFEEARVDGALAARVFHSGALRIPDLKEYLKTQNQEVRL